MLKKSEKRTYSNDFSCSDQFSVLVTRGSDPNLLPRNHSQVLKVVILFCICLNAFLIRLFAVIRFESVIHEFDPYFNFRTTKYLSEHGFEEFWNW